jgi:hypothetical protein
MPGTDNGRAMVSLCQPFSGDEVARIAHVLQKLAANNTHHWALTGSLALEFHLARVGAAPRKRRFTDVDFVVDSFDSIPVELSAEFLFTHVHCTAEQGKLCVQLVEPEAKVRIDVFRTCGETMRRAVNILCREGRFRMLALEDLAARCSRVALGVLSGASIPAKHLDDLLRSAGHIDPVRVRRAWEDHRRACHPDQFEHAVRLLQSLTDEQRSLFTEGAYDIDTTSVCQKCSQLPQFPLAAKERVLALLGYC